MDNVLLRPVTKNDIKLIFNWSNENIVRANSLTREKITWDTHVKWFENTLKSNNVLFFIMVNNGIDVGQVRLDLKEDNMAVITYDIDKRYRGMGYGKKILELAEVALYKRFKDKYLLQAMVKKDNKVSRVIFERLNYKIKNNDNEFVTYYKVMN